MDIDATIDALDERTPECCSDDANWSDAADAGIDALAIDAALDATADGSGLDGDSGTEVETDATRDGPTMDGSGAADALDDMATEAGAEDAANETDAEDAPVDASTADAVVDASLDAAAACPPAIHSGSSAVAYQIDPQHSGAQPGDTLTLPLCQRWSHDFGARVATPVIGGGLVFVLAGVALYALDENTGNVVWGPRYPLAGEIGACGGVALDNGQVYAVCGPNTGLNNGALASYDAATGTPLWQTTLDGGSSESWNWYTAPVALGGVVVAVGGGIGETAYAVNGANGSFMWTNVDDDMSSPVLTTDAVFRHDHCGAVYRIDKNDGGIVWSRSGSCSGAGGYEGASLLGGELYVPLDHATEQGIGVIVDPITGAGDGGTFVSGLSPAASAGIGYFVSYDSPMTAVSLGTATPLWTTTGSTFLTSPIVVGTNIVIGGGSELDVYSTDGELVSSAPVSAAAAATVPVRGLQEADGVLLIVSDTSVMAF